MGVWTRFGPRREGRSAPPAPVGRSWATKAVREVSRAPPTSRPPGDANAAVIEQLTVRGRTHQSRSASTPRPRGRSGRATGWRQPRCSADTQRTWPTTHARSPLQVPTEKPHEPGKRRPHSRHPLATRPTNAARRDPDPDRTRTNVRKRGGDWESHHVKGCPGLAHT